MSAQDDRPVVLCVFGAGASFDSNAAGLEQYPYQPPLTEELFSRSEFATYRTEFRALSGITQQLLQLPDGVTIEQRLAKLYESSRAYQPAARELASVAFYLRRVLYSCGETALSRASRNTTYAELIRRVDEWAAAEGRLVCIVTFNYDTLIEAALQDMGLPIAAMDDYISSTRSWHLLKLHGSWNWVREIDDTRYQRTSEPNGPRISDEKLIDDYHDLGLSTRFHIRGTNPGGVESNYVEVGDVYLPAFPGLALPLTNKTEFVCPHEHVEDLRLFIPRVTQVISIGWHAQEHHFLRELALIKAPSTPTLVVTRSMDGAVSVQRNLEQVGGIKGPFRLYEGGFSAFLRGGTQLESFLAGDSSDVR